MTTRVIGSALRGGQITAYFEGHGGERSIPRGWLETDWLRERLLIDSAVPIDKNNNTDHNAPERLVYFRHGDWRAMLPSLAQKGGDAPRKAKRGPKFKYDWNEGRQYFDRLMSDRGDLDDRQEWSAQADIERLVLNHMKKHGGGEPSPSAVQGYVSAWLADFRASQSGH
jgi:hypothetical protein